MKKGTFNCKSKFLIYLITRGECGIQYVGQTVQFLHVRLNGHRYSSRNSVNTYIYQHFNNHGHDFSKIKIQIIDILDPELCDAHDLDLLENFWIDTLETAYPFGLNDRIKGVGNISKNQHKQNLTCYLNSRTSRCSRGHGVSKKNKKDDPNYNRYDHGGLENFVNELSHLFRNEINKFYMKIKSCGRKMLKAIHNINVDLSIKNIISSFLNYGQNNTPMEDKVREYIVLPFNCKFIDRLSFDSIIRDTSLESLLPKAVADKLPLKIYYKYSSPIGKELINYNSFLNNLTNNDIKDIVGKDCDCATSTFKDEFHQHIVTGNLGLISNIKLKEIMAFGAKYREPLYLTPDIIRRTICDSIDNFIDIKSKIYNIDKREFEQWRYRVFNIIDNRIKFYEQNKPCVFNGEEAVLKRRKIKSYIKELQQKYIIVVADKASNNFVFICKKFYVLTIMKELGIDNVSYVCSGNVTYKAVDKTENQLILEHANILKDKFKLKCKDRDRVIPKVFWNAKLHKTPSKARFIAGARHCTTKELSVKVNTALQIVKESFIKYCEVIHKHTGVNCNWSISSSYEFINKLKGVDIHSMQVYDFTTLYTNLNLMEVENSLNSLIDLIFSNKNKYICIGYKKSFFSSKKYNGYYFFDKQLIKDAINFIIYNTYIKFGHYILKQTKGIPIGGNCSSPLADLALAYKEFIYMKQLLKNKKINLARLLSNNSRYVDDINIMNYKNFDKIVMDIYPIDLEVERSGANNKNINYLDINIKIDRDGVSTSVYNKTDLFDFPVVSFTYPSGNIPMQLGYNVFYGQVLRYSRICSDKHAFLNKTKYLFNTMRDRGYNINMLYKSFKKLFIKDHFNLLKFGYSEVIHIFNDFKQL